MKQYFLKLFEYTDWANKRVLAGLKKQSVTDQKILSVMGHVLAAQVIWLNRIEGMEPPKLKLWDDYEVKALENMAKDAGRRWVEYIGRTKTFNRELSYKNYVGDPFTNNVEMIMIHVANHGTYHRAQIAMLLRQKGYEPVNTDFITYDRVIRGQLKD